MSFESASGVEDLLIEATRIRNGVATPGERDQFAAQLFAVMQKTVVVDGQELTVQQVYRRNLKEHRESIGTVLIGQEGAKKVLRQTEQLTGIPHKLVQMWVTAENHRANAPKPRRR